MNFRTQTFISLENFVSVIFLTTTFCLLIGGCAFGQNGKSKSQTQADVRETPAKTQEKTIVGRWKSDEATVEIKSNGKLTINGDLFNYEINGTTLTISNNEGTLDFPFKLNGDTLTVSVQGRKVVYTRMGESDDEERTERPTKNGGNVPPELVGKWCYMANIQANNGGRMSERCVTLFQNGTYQYYSETNSSNPNGGTSSQSSDSGRWTATATTFTAYSNTGETKTYSLEKRNHPKTGDPMLIVDGDAFVTYYQKQPW